MKLALVLAFCVALASARLPGFEERSWSDDWESGPATCHVSSRKVKTFDNVKLPISLPNCYTVLHKDCSSDPKVVVLIRKLSQNSDLKEIKILTRSHKVVLTPSENNDRIRVKVNDQERPLNEDLELVANGYPVIRIIKEGQQQLKVESLAQGLKLRFDGYVCDIKLSEESRNKQCGLCGISKLQLKSGYRSNEQLNSRDVRNLFIKYVTRDCRYTSESDNECNGYNCQSKRSSLLWPESDDENCDDVDCQNQQQSQNWLSDDLFQQSPRQQSQRWLSDDLFQQSPRLYSDKQSQQSSRKQQSQNWFSDDLFQQSPRLYSDEIFGEDNEDLITREHQYTSGRRPQLKHKVVEREDQVCVSLVRIPQCPANSYPQQKIEKRIPYKCVSRNDQRVRQLESRIRSGERIPEIQRLTPSLTRTEIIPVKCSQSY